MNNLTETADSTLVCEDCGSTKVQTMMWVSVNSNEVHDGCGGGDSSDNWCPDCSEHCNIITYKEYKEEEEE